MLIGAVKGTLRSEMEVQPTAANWFNDRRHFMAQACIITSTGTVTTGEMMHQYSNTTQYLYLF